MADAIIKITPLAPALGAEIEGVDLSQPLSDDTIGQIRQALLDNLVIFFHDQHLTPEQHLALGRCFGTLNIHAYVEGMADYPELMEVRKEPEDARNFGGQWHADVSYLAEPPLGSILYAKEVPEVGGDTLWANLYLAYETLSPGMRKMLDGVTAVHTPAKALGLRAQDGDQPSSIRMRSNSAMEMEHPVVRTHPETGRKLLFIGGDFTPRFTDMTEEESKPLLDYLMTHITSETLTCRYRWRQNDVAFWDNRSTLHYALNDYAGRRRVMHRVTINGDRPF